MKLFSFPLEISVVEIKINGGKQDFFQGTMFKKSYESLKNKTAENI